MAKDTVIELLLLFVLLFLSHSLSSFDLLLCTVFVLAMRLPCVSKLELSWVKYHLYVSVSDVAVLSSVQNAAMFTSLLPMICACVGPVAVSEPHVCIHRQQNFSILTQHNHTWTSHLRAMGYHLHI